MTDRTVTFNDDAWQLVPKVATRDMLMDLKSRADDIVKMTRQPASSALLFNCDFALVYRLMLASAPAHSAGERRP